MFEVVFANGSQLSIAGVAINLKMSPREDMPVHLRQACFFFIKIMWPLRRYNQPLACTTTRKPHQFFPNEKNCDNYFSSIAVEYIYIFLKCVEFSGCVTSTNTSFLSSWLTRCPTLLDAFMNWRTVSLIWFPPPTVVRKYSDPGKQLSSQIFPLQDILHFLQAFTSSCL